MLAKLVATVPAGSVGKLWIAQLNQWRAGSQERTGRNAQDASNDARPRTCPDSHSFTRLSSPSKKPTLADYLPVLALQSGWYCLVTPTPG